MVLHHLLWMVLWHVLWPQLGGYCGWWKRVVLGWFRVKMACTRDVKELSGMQLCSLAPFYLSRPNSDLYVLRLYGMLFESRI